MVLFEDSETISALAYRKRRDIRSACLPQGLRSIGDAAFAHCTNLHKIEIPDKVHHIGIAAFCKSGLESITFHTVPDMLDETAFACCDQLQHIYVPQGKVQEFIEHLPSFSHLIEAQDEMMPYTPRPARIVEDINLFGERTGTRVIEGNLFHSNNEDLTPRQQKASTMRPVVKRIAFRYNEHNFYWSCGDIVSLDDLFSGPTTINGSPSYQFRKKVLFIFVSPVMASKVIKRGKYTLKANTVKIQQKWQEKYGSFKPRVFVFQYDGGQDAIFLDEVLIREINDAGVSVESIII